MAAPFARSAQLDRSARLGMTELLVGLCTLVFFYAIYERLMGYGLLRDEMMFVLPTASLDQQQPGVDFFDNHLPYAAWYFWTMDRLFGDAGLLFSARLGVFFAWGLLAASTAWVVWVLSGSLRVTLFGVLGLLTSQTLLGPSGMAATNNLLQLPFAVLALGLFLIETTRAKPRFLRLVLAGICAAVAIGMKLNAVAFLPAMVVAALFTPAGQGFGARLGRVLLPLVVGGVIGGLPMIWYFSANPEQFLADVLRFDLGARAAYWDANQFGEPWLATGPVGKLHLAFGAWLEGAPLVMTAVILPMVLCLARGAGGDDPADPCLRRGIWVVAATIALTVVISFLPTPGFPQYFILPLACLPLLAALAYRSLDDAWCMAIRPVLVSAIILMAVLALPQLVPDLAVVAGSAESTPAATTRGGTALKQAIEDQKPGGDKVATFFPVYPLEAGLPVYPEFTTGQFGDGILSLTAPDQARQYRVVGADGIIKALFDADPPAAMLLGYEPELEVPLRRYAETHGYQQVEVQGLGNRYGDGTVYLNLARAQQ